MATIRTRILNVGVPPVRWHASVLLLAASAVVASCALEIDSMGRAAHAEDSAAEELPSPPVDAASDARRVIAEAIARSASQTSTTPSENGDAPIVDLPTATSTTI